MTGSSAAQQQAWENLNAEQREAVDAVLDRVLVMAPVGTGKTNVLTLRAAGALQQNIAAESILCLSFTNKAARQMKDRLFSFLGKGAARVSAHTFHGLCAAILRAEAETVGIPGDFLIYDEEDCREVFGRMWRGLGLDVDPDMADRFEFRLAQAAAEARLTQYDRKVPRKHAEIITEALRDLGMTHLASHLDFRKLLFDYVRELRDNHALDFTDLIVGVNRLFSDHPAALERWQEKFSWIQVDEIQDTSRSEYRILALLAARHKQLSFFGDLDQTIYEWRGSAPFEILDEYREQFHPVREIRFSSNYRSTRAILRACQKVIQCYPRAVTQQIVAQVAEEGEPVKIHPAVSIQAEAEWIVHRIDEVRSRTGLPYRDIVVLTRTNFTARDLSPLFERLKLPHVQVEQFKFFQREEVKNALSHLRLLTNRHDGNSLLRVLKTPPKGIGEASLRDLRGEPRQAGLRLSDLLDPLAAAKGDPFAPLLDALDAGRLVVFDTETTGTEIGRDEIVELAAARCSADGITAGFQAYLKPGCPVGKSESVHGLSDEFLGREGRNPAEVLREFEEFRGDAVLAGHNVWAFDLPMLQAARRMAGMEAGEYQSFDTLDLARRLHNFPRYTLGELARQLQLPSIPSHRAGDDVATTVELIQHLARSLVNGEQARRRAVAKYAKSFAPLAQSLERWRRLAGEERPGALLRRVLEESGLDEYYRRRMDEPKRAEHLEELARLFEAKDDSSLDPFNALWNLLSVTSLGNDLDREVDEDDRVRLLTVHQAKGLEFDTVFLAGAADHEFPSARSLREGRLNEEHRLFYVAISRAKRRLFVSYSTKNSWNRPARPSRFLKYLE